MTEQRPLLDTLAEMTAASVSRADLDDRELMLVRLAGWSPSTPRRPRTC